MSANNFPAMKNTVFRLVLTLAGWVLASCLVVASVYLKWWLVAVSVFVVVCCAYSILYFRYDVARGQSLYFFAAACVLGIWMFAAIYANLGIINTHPSATQLEFRDFLYFSVVTWTTLGYGDLQPSVASRPFAAVEALLGYIFMALFVAKLFHFISAAVACKGEVR